MKKWKDESYEKNDHPITDKNDRMIMHLRDMNHTMRSLYEGKGSQRRILIMLLEQGGMTQKKLTERLGIQPGSASEVLMKLERGDLITRTENPEDRRTIDVRLTEQGQEMAKEAANQRRKRHEEMFSCLSQEEADTLLELLEKVNASWQERYGNTGERIGRKHGHFYGHDREENERFHRHGREENERFHKHSREEDEHFHRHKKDREEGCDGNCRACEHPCRRR